MKLDWYSKLVLTVIALCLLWLSIKDAVILRRVQAAGAMPVQVSGSLNIGSGTGIGVHIPTDFSVSICGLTPDEARNRTRLPIEILETH
jgi:hypothetical protein